MYMRVNVSIDIKLGNKNIWFVAEDGYEMKWKLFSLASSHLLPSFTTVLHPLTVLH